jgi:hypothetical protein
MKGGSSTESANTNMKRPGGQEGPSFKKTALKWRGLGRRDWGKGEEEEIEKSELSFFT